MPFEPGSVFKVITLSAALETTNLRPESPINCNGGKLTLSSRTIHDSHAGMGVVPMATVLAKSSNIGAIQVGLRVGQPNMYDYMRRFGFGQKTGMPLPGESPGKVRRLERWGKTSLASVSMGQEVSVTTLQLAQAASVIANGGMLVKPRLVLKKGDQTQPVSAAGPRPQAGDGHHDAPDDGRRGAVRHGHQGAAGRLLERRQDRASAQIFDFAAKHYTHTYNGSYMGFAPLTNPRRGGGGHAERHARRRRHSARTRRRRSSRWSPPKRCAFSMFPRTCRKPRRSDAGGARTAANDLDDLAVADLGATDRTFWKRATTTRPRSQAVLRTAAGAGRGGRRAAQAAGSAASRISAARPCAPCWRRPPPKGLTVLPDGSGIARVQSPPPGSPLHQGERIRVQFAR